MSSTSLVSSAVCSFFAGDWMRLTAILTQVARTDLAKEGLGGAMGLLSSQRDYGEVSTFKLVAVEETSLCG